MNTQSESMKVAKDLVVSLEYTLTVDGEVIDSSKDDGVLDYLQGHDNLIPGLEKELEGMKVGESKKVFVKAKDGYGEYDPEAIENIPVDEFPKDIPMEVGVELAVEDEDGVPMSAVIEAVDKENVTLNFNHPLAGKDLSFDVKIAGIREPTAEELDHGHVHDDEECECGCEDEESDCDCCK